MGFCSAGPLQSHQDEGGEAGGIRKALERNPHDPPPQIKARPLVPGHLRLKQQKPAVRRRVAEPQLCGMKPSVVDFAVFNYSWTGKSSASLSGSPGSPARSLHSRLPAPSFL